MRVAGLIERMSGPGARHPLHGDRVDAQRRRSARGRGALGAAVRPRAHAADQTHRRRGRLPPVMPLIGLPSESSGVCRLAVEIGGSNGDGLAGVLVDVRGGRVASCWPPSAARRCLGRGLLGELARGGDPGQRRSGSRPVATSTSPAPWSTGCTGRCSGRSGKARPVARPERQPSNASSSSSSSGKVAASPAATCLPSSIEIPATRVQSTPRRVGESGDRGVVALDTGRAERQHLDRQQPRRRRIGGEQREDGADAGAQLLLPAPRWRRRGRPPRAAARAARGAPPARSRACREKLVEGGGGDAGARDELGDEVSAYPSRHKPRPSPRPDVRAGCERRGPAGMPWAPAGSRRVSPLSRSGPPAAGAPLLRFPAVGARQYRPVVLSQPRRQLIAAGVASALFERHVTAFGVGHRQFAGGHDRFRGVVHSTVDPRFVEHDLGPVSVHPVEEPDPEFLVAPDLAPRGDDVGQPHLQEVGACVKHS